MDANTIMQIKPELTRFLHQFDDWDTRDGPQFSRQGGGRSPRYRLSPTPCTVHFLRVALRPPRFKEGGVRGQGPGGSRTDWF